MGLLRKGDIMPWTELFKTREILKNRGIDQFIKAYRKNKDNVTTTKAFGEELELMMLIKDGSTYKLYCQGEIITDHLETTSVEYARYMVEISSIKPYTNLRGMEEGIIRRVEEIERYINSEYGKDNKDNDHIDNDIFKEDHINNDHIDIDKDHIDNDHIDNDHIDIDKKDIISVLMLPCFPHLHFPMFYDTKPLTSDLTLSLNFPDNGITQHKRFESLTENIRNRRGRKPEGRIQVMNEEMSVNHINNDYILIDSVGQGMGCCGLQLTIQASTIDEARFIYDMAGVLGPLLLRLSRGTPCANGKLLQTETRWEMLEMSVDCRRDTERGFECVYSNSYSEYPYTSEIPKSRCSAFDLYISNDERNLPHYNDTNPPIHGDIYKRLTKGGIDERLARHVASLFIRDPFVSYLSTNEETYDDFENIQSSNWRSVRFKLPTENADDTNGENLKGWKVEVRPMEMQATPFENTALIYFTYLLIQAILEYDLNLYIPISKVDTNFIRANIFSKSIKDLESEDTQKFYYRKNINKKESDLDESNINKKEESNINKNDKSACKNGDSNIKEGESNINIKDESACKNGDSNIKEGDSNKKNEYIKEGTLREIFNKEDGLLKYVYRIIEEKYQEDKPHIIKYIKFIEDKINNKYLCLSDWIRKYIINHRDYKGDSIVNDEIVQDLLGRLIEIRKENTVEYLKKSTQ